MDVNSYIFESLINASYISGISTKTIGGASALLAMYSLLDIFTGSNISELRLGFWFYYYLKKVPKILPTKVDIILVIFFGVISLFALFLPNIDGKQRVVIPNVGLVITAPANWNVEYTRPPYNSVLSRVKTANNLLISQPVADYIFIAQSENSIGIPDKFVSKTPPNNFIDWYYEKKSGKTLVDKEIIAIIDHNGLKILIYSKTNSHLIKMVLESLTFIDNNYLNR